MSLPLALTGNVGDSLVVRTNQIDAYGQASSTTITWSTSNAAVATANAVFDRFGYGVINCLSAGSATITATAGSTTVNVLLTVVTPSIGNAATLTVESITPAANKTVQTLTYPKVS